MSGLLFLGAASGSAVGDEKLGPRRHMLALTNTDRVHHERAALSFAERLAAYAKSHSEAMADKGYIYHSTGDQLREALEGYKWELGGENVGVGGSLESLEDAFMASDPAPQEHPSQGVRPRGRGHRSRRRSDLGHGHLLRLSRSGERERPRGYPGVFRSFSLPTYGRLVLVL